MAANSKSKGLSAIQRAKIHYQNQPIREIQVPEWADDDGNPFIFYVKPFTLQDQGRLQFAIRDQSEADALAEVLILKALDDEGNKVFQIGDKIDLRQNVDATVLARIANQIIGGTTEELEKN
ncbi:MAG: hypothetical protein VW620_11500 [Rhodospirillales bacterium]